MDILLSIRPWGLHPSAVLLLALLAAAAVLLLLASVQRRRRRRDQGGNEQGLGGAERHFRRLLERLPVIVYESRLDEGAQPVYVNPQVEELLGYSAESFLARPELWRQRIHPEDLPRIEAAAARLRAGGELMDLDYRVRARDGRILWFRDEGVVLREGDGAVRIFGLMEEISGRKEAEGELARAKVAAEAASRARSRFLAAMSHELKTPLNAILGFSELLADGSAGRLTPQQREYVGYVASAGERLLGMIEQLLELARLDAGEVALALEELAPRGPLEAAQAELEPRASKRGVELEVELAPELPAVRADRERFRNIAVYLVESVLAGSQNGDVVKLEARPSDSGGLLLSGSSTGEAFSELLEEGVFDLLEAGRDSYTQHYPGAGVALALLRRLVALHGGEVRAAPPAGGRPGRFLVELPAAASGASGL